MKWSIESSDIWVHTASNSEREVPKTAPRTPITTPDGVVDSVSNVCQQPNRGWDLSAAQIGTQSNGAAGWAGPSLGE